MESVHQNVAVVFPAINVGVELLGVVAAVPLQKPEQVNLVAEVCLEAFLVGLYFPDQHVEDSLDARQLDELILGFPEVRVKGTYRKSVFITRSMQFFATKYSPRSASVSGLTGFFFSRSSPLPGFFQGRRSWTNSRVCSGTISLAHYAPRFFSYA